jgi:glucose/arabinose dehydrogenase
MMGPHIAKLDLRFYAAGMFPGSDKKVSLFTVRHGWWIRSAKPGNGGVAIELKNDRSVASVEPCVISSPDNNKCKGGPVDVQKVKDGSLPVSDNRNGTVRRVSGKK